jgi:hypothetical protein
MLGNALINRIFDALASLRLAVVTMLTLGTTCAFATFYEMQHGTEAAQREIYKTPGFTLILVTLGINIFCVMMKRYPWKSHHVGFVLAHIGILTLLAGSLISLHYGLDSNMPLFEGESTNRVTLLSKTLQVALPGHTSHGEFPAEFEKRLPKPGREQRFAIPGSDATLVADDFEPNVRVDEGFAEGDGARPALQVLLDNPFAKQEIWLLADDPERGELAMGPAAFAFRTAASETEAKALAQPVGSGNRLTFVLGPGDRLTYSLAAKSGPGLAGAVEIGKPVETPWMGMKVVALKLVPRAVSVRSVSPETPAERDERRMPAVKVHLEGRDGKTPSEWLLWSEARNVPFAGGQATVAFRSPELEVPFKVTLIKFNSDKYPGSNQPATYESWVRVEDPETGTSEHHISMNNPLHYRGYIFFQASFVEGTPMMSIFSVARAPGLPLVYAGVFLIGAGVAWMFYLKPYLVRRQAVRALEAHRLRETRNEADRAHPVSVPAAAKPASSGA